MTTALGYFAGLLTTISFVMQVIKTWKTKSTGDLSLGMFVVFSVGVLCWVVYGIMIQELPIIVWNTITLILATSILWMKINYP